MLSGHGDGYLAALKAFHRIKVGQVDSHGGSIEGHCSWIVPLRDCGVRPPLFCASALGGDALDYRDLASALPDDQPVYSLRMPSLSEAKELPTVEGIAAAYVLRVRELQQHGPYYLCGHSFGGLVAYEMARSLAREGEDVSLVALLDAEVPAFSRTLPLKQRANYYATYFFNRLAKYGRNLLRGRIDRILMSVINTCIGRLKKSLWRATPALFGAVGREVPNQIRSNHLVFTTAWWTYKPAEYGGRVDLLVASDRPPEYRVDSTLGWRPFAPHLVLKIVPGTHDSMLHSPCVIALAEYLIPLLGDAAAQLPSGIR
jgi:pimeloyl-ACP methyl ester carboxylesterase